MHVLVTALTLGKTEPVSSRKPKTNQKSDNCNGAGPVGLDDKPKFSWLETEVDEATLSLVCVLRSLEKVKPKTNFNLHLKSISFF